jgi:Holliday junction DNA helicase RuvA
VIAFVKGTVAGVTLTSAVLEVGGVGLELNCTPNTLATLRVGAATTLPTSMVVREESLTLFGFLDDDEKAVFELLQTASGVGPKLAQAMLAVHSPDELRRAVSAEDVRALTAVPGIGQKGAQRIILELKDRIGAPTGAGPDRLPAITTGQDGAWRGQVHAGLVGLGWSAKEADKAVETVAPEAEAADGEPNVAQLLRAALRTLSKA